MYQRWKFSKQSKKEFEEFLHAIKTKDDDKNIASPLLKSVLPQLPLSYYNHEDTEGDHIIIIEDDPMLEPEQENEIQASLQMSILNLTLTEENVNVNDFCEYLTECLNNTNDVGEIDIKKLSELNITQITELYITLNDTVSSTGLMKLGESVCKNCRNSMSDIVQKYCEIILLKKITNFDTAQTFKTLLLDFTKIFPETTRKYVLLPLLITDYKCLKIYQTLLTIFCETEKEQLLRDFVFTSSELQEFQLQMIQPLLQLTTDQSIKRRMIDLMSISADKFNNDRHFMKLIIELIKILEISFIDQEHVLYEIIEKNKTILKTIAHKTLEEWVDSNKDD